MGGAASFQIKTDNHKDDGKQLSNNLVWYSVKKKRYAFNVCVCVLSGPKGKCGLSKPCPVNYYTFKIDSGATNIIGPQICFEGKM